MIETETPMIEAVGVRRAFGGLTAVDVDRITVPRGKLTALIGPNGAGKSTLFNIITGFERRDAGSWSFNGQDVTGSSPQSLARAGLIRSFQLTRLIPGTSVLDNMLLAAPLQRGERLAVAGWHRGWRKQERDNIAKAESLLERMRLADKRDEDAAGLSGGQRRLLEVARSLMSDPKALLLDEPLAGVNPALRETVMEHLVQLRNEGLTILFIEHDMDAVMGLSDYVVCMGSGRRISEGTARQVAADPVVVEAYLGKGTGGVPAVSADPARASIAPAETALLQVSEIVAGYQPENPIIRSLDARVDAGEIVAVIGANGAGKSTFLKTIAGVVPARSGSIMVDGHPFERLPAHVRVRRGLGYVPQSQNVFPSLTVAENLRMGGYAEPRSLSQRIDRVLDVFPLLKPMLTRPAGSLSGGQRQAVGMARALVAEPKLLLLDEPSAGLSPSAQEVAFEHVRAIARTGVGILIVEQNARECLAISDRAYVLEQGKVALSGTGAELLVDPRVIELYLGSLRIDGDGQ